MQKVLHVLALRTKTLGFSQAVKQFGLPRATLKKHMEGKNKFAKDGKKKLGRNQDLPQDIEKELCEHISLLTMESRFYGLTRSTLLSLAHQIAEANHVQTRFNKVSGKARKEWLRRFLKRHTEISLRQPEWTSLARAVGFNRTRVADFYDKLHRLNRSGE